MHYNAIISTEAVSGCLGDRIEKNKEKKNSSVCFVCYLFNIPVLFFVLRGTNGKSR